MLIAENISYLHPNRDLLFDNISLSLGAHQKVALLGNNGTGKSTLLRLLAARIKPASGLIRSESTPYYVPQHFGQFNGLSIAEAMGIDAKIRSLRAILDGDMSDGNLDVLQDDWDIEERTREALDRWELDGIDLNRCMSALSGGEKTRVFLAGIAVHDPALVLLDEPSNHLDRRGRELLLAFLRDTSRAVLVVSHDRELLRIPETIWELDRGGIGIYGGNYDFYLEQKRIEAAAFEQELRGAEKALRKAKETEREVAERRQRLESRGRKKADKAGTPTIMLNTLRNNAEKSSSRLKDAQRDKIGSLSDELNRLRSEQPAIDTMKLVFGKSGMHRGRILVKAVDVNFGYGAPLWTQPISLELRSGDRLALRGANGSGKSTLIRLLLGSLEPSQGSVLRAPFHALYLDQDYSVIDPERSVYEQLQDFNGAGLEEHELKRRLTHFLFDRESWDKPASALSGGEKMRLVLCCLSIGKAAPELIVLDEPTNNLDLQNIGMLTEAVKLYEGALLVVSHDLQFLQDIGISASIGLE